MTKFMLITNGWWWLYTQIYKYILEKKDNNLFRTCLAALQVKFLSKIYIKLQVIWVILQVLHELQVIKNNISAEKCTRKIMYFHFFLNFRANCSKTWLHTSHNLKAMSYHIPVHNLHQNATAETKIACYKMCTSYSTIRMKVTWLPLYKSLNFSYIYNISCIHPNRNYKNL